MNMASFNEAPHVDAVLGWIHAHVDEAVPRPSCVEIMMLGMRTELTQEDWERERFPSGLYYALKRKNIYINEQELLARFIFALELLNRERMEAVIDKLPRDLMPQSPFDPSKQCQKFQFNQCLVKVCIRLRDTSQRVRQKFVNYCAHLCNMTAKNFKNIRSLIFKLLEKDEINEGNQATLAQGLVAVHEYDCFRLIQKYREDNDLEPMDLELIRAEVDLTIQNHPHIISESENTDNLTSQPLVQKAAHDIDASSESQRRNAKALNNRSGTPDSIGGSESLGPTTTNPSVQGGRRRTADIRSGHTRSRILVFSRQRRNRSRTDDSSRKPCDIVSCAIALILVVLVAIVAAFASVTAISEYVVNGNHTVGYYDDSVVVLSEVSHFFTQALVVSEEPNNMMDTPKIDLYTFNKSCNSLPLEPDNIIFNKGTTDLSDLNSTVLYLLPKSNIHLQICTDTNSTTPLQVVLLDKLELAKSVNDKQELLRKSFNHTTFTFDTSNCEYYNQTIPHGHRNYYTLLIFTQPPNNPPSLEFNSSLVVKGPSIITSLAQSKQTLNKSLTFTFHFSFARSCIIANIDPSHKNGENGTVDTHFGRLYLNFEPFDIWVMHTGFGISGGLVFVVSLFVVVLVVVCVYCRQSQRRYQRVPTN